MNGMADIIPPVPAHDGLAALLAPASASSGWLILALALLIVLSLLMSAWLMRRRLLARLRLAQAKHRLHAGRVDGVEKRLRQHYELAQLHPAKPPMDVDAACWRALVEGLHEIRFGGRTLNPRVLCDLLGHAFPPQSPVSSCDKFAHPQRHPPYPVGINSNLQNTRGDMSPNPDQGSRP